MGEDMISIQNLTKYYDSHKAVDDLNVEIQRGEILGLLGPNGAGKTTTMRILTCYLKPSSGTIEVKDLNIKDDPLDIKQLIGYLPESAPLYAEMLTYDYLAYIAAVRGISKEDTQKRIDELVDLCGLDEVMHKSVKELSRGYKQRVGLAHAMMSDPEILVLDEPTAGLDPNQIVQIRSIIKKMGEKKTVILSTHILTEAEATCDRIVIIDNGKLVADGTPESLGEGKINSQIVRVVLRNAVAQNVVSTLGRVPGVSKTAVADPTSRNEIEVQVFCDGDYREDLYRCIKGEDWLLVEFAHERQSLEDTFRELTLSETKEEA